MPLFIQQADRLRTTIKQHYEQQQQQQQPKDDQVRESYRETDTQGLQGKLYTSKQQLETVGSTFNTHTHTHTLRFINPQSHVYTFNGH